VFRFSEEARGERHCPVCDEETLRVVDAREPKGFFTDLEPKDFEGQFEWTPRSTRPTLGINEPSEQPRVDNAVVVAIQDHIQSINDCGGNGGFDFRPARVYGESRTGAYAVIDPVEEGEGEPTSREHVTAQGTSHRVALLASRLTDVLLVGIAQWPVGVYADPTMVEGRAAWYSLAFWLRLAAGVHLDVDALELQAGFRSLLRDGRPAGQAFLCDQLENGAGYCRELARPDRFRDVLTHADPSLPDSLAGKWTELSPASGVIGPHAAECDTSCNRCLRDFHNLSYHGLLDWRLALDMARLASSVEARIDLESPWSDCTNPWSTIVSGPNAPIPATMARLGYGPPDEFGPLRGYVRHNQQLVSIERHPLWTDDHPSWRAAESVARERYPESELRSINPFRTLRRPADCL
jgi:hypothetical protein